MDYHFAFILFWNYPSNKIGNNSHQSLIMPPTIIDLTLVKSPSPAPAPASAPAPAIAPVLTTAQVVVAKKPLVNAVLLKELATTPEDRLRRLVRSICQANSEAARMAAKTLLVPESESTTYQRRNPPRMNGMKRRKMKPKKTRK